MSTYSPTLVIRWFHFDVRTPPNRSRIHSQRFLTNLIRFLHFNWLPLIAQEAFSLHIRHPFHFKCHFCCYIRVGQQEQQKLLSVAGLHLSCDSSPIPHLVSFALCCTTFSYGQLINHLRSLYFFPLLFTIYQIFVCRSWNTRNPHAHTPDFIYNWLFWPLQSNNCVWVCVRWIRQQVARSVVIFCLSWSAHSLSLLSCSGATDVFVNPNFVKKLLPCECVAQPTTAQQSLCATTFVPTFVLRAPSVSRFFFVSLDSGFSRLSARSRPSPPSSAGTTIDWITLASFWFVFVSWLTGIHHHLHL